MTDNILSFGAKKNIDRDLSPNRSLVSDLTRTAIQDLLKSADVDTSQVLTYASVYKIDNFRLPLRFYFINLDIFNSFIHTRKYLYALISKSNIDIK